MMSRSFRLLAALLAILLMMPMAASAAEAKPARSAKTDLGTGSLYYASGSGKLTKKMELLLLDYMNDYYISLAELDARNPKPYFAPDAKKQLFGNRTVWQVQVELRKMQKVDLTLTGYSFQLVCKKASKLENGDIIVYAMEDFVQNFSAYPGVDSKGFNLGHTFLFTKTDDGWLLKDHRQLDSLYHLVYGQGSGTDATRDYPTLTSLSGVNFTNNKKKLLSEGKKAVAARPKQGNKPKKVKRDNEYDREAAVKYARKWVKNRNRAKYPVYDWAGGNCQNFVSQAIFAGGVPMDHTPPAQWKWYGGATNTAAQAAGRSASWSSVSNFLYYVNQNRGEGMVARSNVAYYYGEPGDVIHMGTPQQWRHTVMITKVMEDEKGNTVDYLIASNTSDLRDFPASAYHYTTQMLIKVYGWNDPPKQEKEASDEKDKAEDAQDEASEDATEAKAKEEDDE